MIKKILILVITVYALASNLEITAKNFKYDKVNNISYFTT
jgi:hypothetical protein